MVAVPESTSSLMDLVRRYRVCWKAWPECLPGDSRTRQVGYALELMGTHEPPVEHPMPGCYHCQRVYAALRKIAEHILPREDRPSIYEVGSFDHAIRYSPARMNRPDILLTITILNRGNVDHPVGECQEHCLREMKQRLKELGAHEG